MGRRSRRSRPSSRRRSDSNGRCLSPGFRGEDPAEIAVICGLEGQGFVSNYRSAIAALLDGTIPKSPTLAGQVAARVRTWMKKPGLSPELRDHLSDLQTRLQASADDPFARSVEEHAAKERTTEAEDSRTPGIYVYTLPHYLRYPYDPDTGRTLLKVGRSERDPYERAYAQGRITSPPEDPILLRVNPASEGETAAVEGESPQWVERRRS